MITDPDDLDNKITKPMSKMTQANKKQYVADVKVMNYLLQAIPNDIYNSVDARNDAKQMWERIRRLMYGSEVTKQQRHSRLMNEFENFAAKEGESLESVYERLSTLVNVMDHNDVRHIKSSQSHASPSYSHSPQQYYVTHPSSLVDYEEDHQGENQAAIHDGRVDIQTKNAGYGRNGKRNAGRQNKNQAAIAGNGQCYNCNAKGHYARDCLKPKVRNAKYFREQMLLAMKDEVGGTLNDEENDFMLDHAYGDETLEELTEAISEVNALQIDLISGMISKGVHEHTNHEQTNHEQLKTVINTSDDDQIDYNIIFDDPYVANNGGTDKHDSNAHDQSFNIESLVYNVQREVENQQRLNKELKKHKEMLQKELETCNNSHETQLAKKAFKERENRYLEDIVDLEDKLSSYDRNVYKTGQSIQTIHVLGKQPNKVYDHFLKDGNYGEIGEVMLKGTHLELKRRNLKILEQVGLAGDLGSTNDVLIPLVHMTYSIPLNTAYRSSDIAIVYPLFQKLSKTQSLDHLSLPGFNLISDLKDQFKEEETESMVETIEEYICKTRGDYGSGFSRPKIDGKAHCKLKGQFLKELCDNTFSGSDHEDVNEHIEKVLEIVDLFHILEIPQDQIMIRAFPIFKELLMRCPQHYLTDMQEVTLFYKGLEVPTRQILDSKGAIPTMTAADARVAIQDMAKHSPKWHDGTSTRTRSTETSDGLAAIQA
ncbi:putative ribonuclease H-like domain-containing protein [Tanacetum coccineum]